MFVKAYWLYYPYVLYPCWYQWLFKILRHDVLIHLCWASFQCPPPLHYLLENVPACSSVLLLPPLPRHLRRSLSFLSKSEKWEKQKQAGECAALGRCLAAWEQVAEGGGQAKSWLWGLAVDSSSSWQRRKMGICRQRDLGYVMAGHQHSSRDSSEELDCFQWQVVADLSFGKCIPEPSLSHVGPLVLFQL